MMQTKSVGTFQTVENDMILKFVRYWWICIDFALQRETNANHSDPISWNHDFCFKYNLLPVYDNTHV